jgi:hypothetical protein
MDARTVTVSGKERFFPLEVRVDNRAHYFDISDLKAISRCVVAQTDAATNVSHVYEGVRFQQLLASVKVTTKPEIITIEYGSQKLATISEAHLDAQTQPMVVDTEDKRPLAGPAPYGFS